MGRPISNIRKSQIRVKINKAGYKKLLALAGSVHTALTGNAEFTTPSPSLTSLATAKTALAASTRYMGAKRNRGSKAEFAQAQSDANNVRSILTALLQYVTNTVLIAAGGANDQGAAILATTGFGFRVTRKITPKLQIATFVRQTNNHQFPGNLHRLNWKRPIGLIKGKRPTAYNILIGGVIVQTVTKTNAIIPVAPGANVDVLIQPMNSRGTGNTFNATIKGLS